MKMRKCKAIAVIAAMFLAAGAVTAADVIGVMVLKNNKRMEGTITWNSRRKVYTIKKITGKVTLSMRQDQVVGLIIPKPKKLTSVEAALRKGASPTAAIPVLNSIIDDYFMLKWDKTATRLLAEVYIQNNQAKEAVKACERLIGDNPEAAWKGEMAPSYWAALLKAERPAKLSGLIENAIKTGDRITSAHALLMRGDMLRKESDSTENARKALRDGYLRVVTLYSREKSVQPEALYKAAKCFDKLGQTSRADQMRTTLKSEYGSSSWALK